MNGSLECKGMVCKGISFCIRKKIKFGVNMEFWNEVLTKASWEKLIQLSKEIDFILIGGWAN
jgi:hypothetical protein